jgi:hypothetical protein
MRGADRDSSTSVHESRVTTACDDNARASNDDAGNADPDDRDGVMRSSRSSRVVA